MAKVVYGSPLHGQGGREKSDTQTHQNTYILDSLDKVQSELLQHSCKAQRATEGLAWYGFAFYLIQAAPSVGLRVVEG